MPANEDFDPYRKWLGIAPGLRPPSHYDLLGISLDEDDYEVIDAAAERQTAFVKSQLGKGHDEHVTALSYQIQEAQVTLKDAEARREYDRRLKLFRKRQKKRQVDPHGGLGVDGLPPRTAGGSPRTVGEGSDFLRSYAGVVAILTVAFGAMLWWSFQQPWANPPKVADADRANALFDAIGDDEQESSRQGEPKPARTNSGQNAVDVPSASEAVEQPASLEERLVGTTWINTNNVFFEFREGGVLGHGGDRFALNERRWNVADERTVEVPFSETKVGELAFNTPLTNFKQSEKGSTETIFNGWRIDGPKDETGEWIDFLKAPIPYRFRDWRRGEAIKTWDVQDGVLEFPREKGQWTRNAIQSSRHFQDFELVIECKTNRDANASICLRVPTDAKDDPIGQALELNLGHHFFHVKKFGVGHEFGSIMRFTEIPRDRWLRVDDDWHEIRLRMIGSTGECFIDGKRAYRFDTSTRWWREHIAEMGWHDPEMGQSRSGPLVLLPGHGEVKFRTFKIRSLKADEEPPIFEPYDPSGSPVVLENATETWNQNATDFARQPGQRRFEVGFGANGQGFASAGWHVRNLKTITVDGTMKGAFQNGTPFTNVGLLVDYHTRNGFQKRVLISPMADPNKGTDCPSWGACSAPDLVHQGQPDQVGVGGIPQRGISTLDLTKWAPDDWTHEAWITAHIQDTGPNTSFTGKVDFAN